MGNAAPISNRSMTMFASIWQRMNRGVIVAAALVLIGLIVILVRMPGRDAPTAVTRAFFTVDEGRTWFADDVSRLAPFDKDGKQAVRAYVFKCPDGTKFVAYLERLNPEARRVLEQAEKAGPDGKGAPNAAAIRSAYKSGREVKRPGDANWVNVENLREAGQVMAVKCPNGGSQATEVSP